MPAYQLPSGPASYPWRADPTRSSATATRNTVPDRRRVKWLSACLRHVRTLMNIDDCDNLMIQTHDSNPGEYDCLDHVLSAHFWLIAVHRQL